ncbi:MAG: rhodanese-like domain-containing protein [Bacteroidota bacterium]
MKNPMTNLSLNQKLGLFVGCLGAAAIFVGNPSPGSRSVVSAKELGVLVQREVDHVDAAELADWIIKGKSDFRLFDTRNEKEFAEYHIPGAENVPVAALDTYPLLRNEKIILYSDGGIHAAQAWFFLKAKQYQGVYILRGGLEEWKDRILFPAIPKAVSPEEIASGEKLKEVSRFFGGTPQTGSTKEQSPPNIVMPKPDQAAPGATPAGSQKKKKEGC